MVWAPASAANYTVAHRPSSAIRLVVIHVTESSFLGAIQWFRNPKAQASANYVVSRTGKIDEMVPDSDIAWQAGNWAINRESIGIEHEGWTYRQGSFTDAEYRASARLVGYELRHYLLPIDRKHVIGHSQVPDPNHPGLFGGFAHHTDPGPYWNWPRYMRYVRAYARGGVPAPTFVAKPTTRRAAKPSITAKVDTSGKVAVSSSGLADGQTVAGFVGWQAQVSAQDVTKVEFLIDGKLRWTERHAPYVFGGDGSNWDTTRETNGPHVLTLRVVTKSGKTAGQSLRVVVSNSPFAIEAAGVANGRTVKGTVSWSAVPSGAKVDHVDFLVDGKVAHTEQQAPYTFDGWDTTALADGPHTLALRAVAADGRVAEASLTVLVANGRGQTGSPAIAIAGLHDGQTVRGKVGWQATVTRGDVAAVEFWVDGRWRWVEHQAPYVFDGDGSTWDTSLEAPGQHVLQVRALSAAGAVLAQQSITVTVAAPETSSSDGSSALAAAAPLTMSWNVANGSTVTGNLAWAATVGGPTPDRVDFYVDGRLWHTGLWSPWTYEWDSTAVADGTHTLALRATAGKQTAWVSAKVTVANTPPLAIASQTLADGQTVSGSVDWEATTVGPTPSRVEFWVDGRRTWVEHQAPFVYGGDGQTWDTTQVADGTHTLTVVAYAEHGATANATIAVTVANAPIVTAPAPSPTPAPVPAPDPSATDTTTTAAAVGVTSETIADGQQLSGVVDWSVEVAGDVRRVEFLLDGRRIWWTWRAPYAFRGDGQLDTTLIPDGDHTLSVRVVGRDGTTATTDVAVTVANGD